MIPSVSWNRLLTVFLWMKRTRQVSGPIHMLLLTQRAGFGKGNFRIQPFFADDVLDHAFIVHYGKILAPKGSIMHGADENQGHL